MYLKKQFGIKSKVWQKPSALILLSALFLAGCGSSDDDGTGSLRFYNLSTNAPAMYLTIDEDLDDEDDDAFERTYTGIEFTELSASTDLDTDNYFYEIAFQDEDDTSRDDLEILLEGSIRIEEDSTQLFVLSSDIHSPELIIYNIPDIDDDEADDDSDDDLFNLRVLNMYTGDDVVSLYFSKDDETFNEAVLIGQYNYQELSDNQKFDQEDYIFYIVDNASSEVVFQSDEIDFPYAAKYVVVIRDNTATGNSPYLLDLISSSSVTEYIDVHTESNIRAYNAIIAHDLIPDYQGNIAVNLESIDYSADTETIALGEFSEVLVQENDDYSIDVTIPETGENLVTNHLLTLSENSDKTVFFYLTETDVDDDGDGDVDEDNDGEVDEVEVNINTLIVENKNEESIYSHQMTMVNLVDNDDFSNVVFYYVRSNELIDSTPYAQLVPYTEATDITLLNNTYTAFVVADIDSSEVILHSFELVLNEESNAQFLILEADETTASGYRLTIEEQ